MFRGADALNDSFDFDLQDIRLTRVSAEDALDVLWFYIEVYASLPNLVTGKDDTPSWFSQPFNSRKKTTETQKSSRGRRVSRRTSKKNKTKKGVVKHCQTAPTC